MAILKAAPKGAEVLDLAAARTARVEARAGQPLPVIKLSAGFVELNSEIDLSVTEFLVEGQTRKALERLLADPADVDALYAEGISTEDFGLIFKFVAGKVSGELSASTTPLKPTGKK